MQRLYLALFVAAIANVPAHAEVDDLVRNVLAMTESGQARQVYELFKPHEVNRAAHLPPAAVSI